MVTRLLICLTLGALGLAVAPRAQESSPFHGQSGDGPLIFPGQIVVTFKAGTDIEGSLGVSRALVPRVGDRALVRPLAANTFAIALSSPFAYTAETLTDRGAEPWMAKAAFESRLDVEAVEPVYIARAFNQPSDPEFHRMWHYHARHGELQSLGGANFVGAWDETLGDESIKIAVIDTGILPMEPEFLDSRNLLSGVDLVSDPWMANDGDNGAPADGLDYDDDPQDPGDAVQPFDCGTWQWYPMNDSWHGSHVAGTVGAGKSNDAAGITGAAWRVSVVPIRVLGRCGAKTVDVAEAIRWAVGLQVTGAPVNTHGPVDIINLSLGGEVPCSAVPNTIQAAINVAVDAGAIVVAAAGNEGKDVSGFFNDDGHPDGVLSVVKGGYDYFNGTSMAAPHVSAAIALLLSTNPTLRAMPGRAKLAEVQNRLATSSVPRHANECPNECGRGLLDAGALVSQ